MERMGRSCSGRRTSQERLVGSEEKSMAMRSTSFRRRLDMSFRLRDCLLVELGPIGNRQVSAIVHDAYTHSPYPFNLWYPQHPFEALVVQPGAYLSRQSLDCISFAYWFAYSHQQRLRPDLECPTRPYPSILSAAPHGQSHQI